MTRKGQNLTSLETEMKEGKSSEIQDFIGLKNHTASDP